MLAEDVTFELNDENVNTSIFDLRNIHYQMLNILEPRLHSLHIIKLPCFPDKAAFN